MFHEDGKEGRVAGELWPLFDDHADSVHSILTLKSNAVALSDEENHLVQMCCQLLIALLLKRTRG